MPLERVPASGAYLEVLERVMDKGIVIDAEVRISVIGLEVLRIDAQVVIASIETYVTRGDVIERLTSPSGSGGGGMEDPALEPDPDQNS